MRTRVVFVVAAVLAGGLAARAVGPELVTPHEQTIYAIGTFIGRNLAFYRLKEDDLPFVTAGLTDAIHKRAKLDPADYTAKIADLGTTRAEQLAKAEEAAAKPVREKAAAEPGARKTASGLVYVEITPGTGASPKPADQVTMRYSGKLLDGTVFDNRDAGTYAVGRSKCWAEALPMMKVGGKSRLMCPPEIAFGVKGLPPHVKPGATVVYEVELLEITK